MNTPLAAITPVAEAPLVIPLTLHVTAVFVVLVTVAVKACELPGRTEALVGEIETVMVGGGGGGGGGVPMAPAPQPSKLTVPHPARSEGKANRKALSKAFGLSFLFVAGVRGRMRRGNAGEGPAKGVRCPVFQASVRACPRTDRK